mmetsp:Transcript_34475/g.85964  ORF Transcript_34475/g.85964 Transcript_34475/m.85964 type:complete len:275 (+) Transcript_34475:877-1701(+)
MSILLFFCLLLHLSLGRFFLGFLLGLLGLLLLLPRSLLLLLLFGLLLRLLLRLRRCLLETLLQSLVHSLLHRLLHRLRLRLRLCLLLRLQGLVSILRVSTVISVGRTLRVSCLLLLTLLRVVGLLLLRLGGVCGFVLVGQRLLLRLLGHGLCHIERLLNRVICVICRLVRILRSVLLLLLERRKQLACLGNGVGGEALRRRHQLIESSLVVVAQLGDGGQRRIQGRGRGGVERLDEILLRSVQGGHRSVGLGRGRRAMRGQLGDEQHPEGPHAY